MISTPPTAPNPNDPATFNARATAWVAWFTTAIPEVNRILGLNDTGEFLAGLPAPDGYVIRNNAVTGAAEWAPQMRYATTKTATGAAVDFTGIPAWVNRVTVLFFGVSLTGVENIFVQLGDSGGIETSGYAAGSSGVNTGVATVNSSNAFPVFLNGAVPALSGSMTLHNMDGNTWIASHAVNAGAQNAHGGGSKILTGTLDRIRITNSGSDSFDAGYITVLWE